MRMNHHWSLIWHFITERRQAFATVVHLMVIGAIALLLGGFYYQTESDTVFPIYIFGMYSGGANAIPDTFGCFAAISDVFNHLYRAGAGSAIYDWFQLLTVLGCAAYWSYQLLSRIAFTSSVKWLAAPLAVAIIDPVMPLEFTKTAMVLSMTGFHVTCMSRAWYHILTGGLLVALGFLVRPEPVTIMLVMVILATPMRTGSMPLRGWVRSIVATASVVLTLSVVFLNSGRTPADVRYKEIRPYEYVLVDFRKDVSEAEGLSIRDKVKLKAARNFFFSDTDELHVAFFKEAGVQPMDKRPIPILRGFVRFDWFMDGWRTFLHGANALKFHLITFMLLPILLWRRHRPLAVFAVLTLLLVLSISMFLKTEHHFITATMSVAILILCGNALPIGRYEERDTGRWQMGLLIVLSALMMSEKFSLVDDSRQKDEYYQAVASELGAHRPESLVLNISFWDRCRYRLFTPVQPAGYERMTVLDGGILYLNDNYQQMLRERTGQETFAQQFMELIDLENRVFVSSERRMNLLVNYMNVVHGHELDYRMISCSAVSDGTSGIEAVGFFEVFLPSVGVY
jgi:hypothetical protein